MLLTEHVNYPLEDQLYNDWIDAQHAATPGEVDAAENACFRLYEVVRKSNRELERDALAGKSFSELTQAFVDHCAKLPIAPGVLGFRSSGPESARWWDQGRLILAVLHDAGRPLGIESVLTQPSAVQS